MNNVTHLYFDLELLEDAVFRSPPGRRTGKGAGLDFVPGSALLGLASGGYATLAPALAWDVFHSGRVRFGDARPIDPQSGSPAMPAPMSLHAPKGTRPNWLGDERIVDFTHVVGDARSIRQYKPLEILVAPSGAAVGVGRRYTLRTAVDFASERAREHQLFGYESIPAGTRFGFTVRIDLPDPALGEVVDLLRSVFNGERALGRSRSAECGLAAFSERQPVPLPWPTWPTVDASHDGLIRLWCVSDVALVDTETGLPTTVPTASHFGLGNAEIDVERTFVRWARWSPFNSHRRRPDVERVALKAGSVVTFAVESESDLDACRRHIGAGVGCALAEGLGDVIAQPRILYDRAGLDASAVGAGVEIRTARSPLPDDALGRWLAPRVARANADDVAWTAAERAFVEQFRRFLARRDAPGRSQWNAVRSIARRHAGGQLDGSKRLLIDTLFSEETDTITQGGFCRHGLAKRLWFGRPKQAGDRLLAFLRDGALDDAAAALALGYLADRMVKGLQAHENAIEVGEETS